jgi:CysZ protein
MKGNVANGIEYLFRGIRLMRTPKLMVFILVPLLINVVVFASLIGWAFSYLNEWVPAWIAALPGWLQFLEWILWPLLVLLFGLFTGYLFTSFTLMIASPFNSLLAEKVEEFYTGNEVEALEGLMPALLAIPKSLLRELRKLAYYLPMALFVFICSWIPVLNLAAPFMWFLLGAWMMSLQFLDYPLDNHRRSFKEVILFAGDERLTTMGFGGAVALCVSIPIVNLLIVPAAVVGATLLYCDREYQIQ